MKNNILIPLILLLGYFSVAAQDLPRPSPSANLEQKIGLTWTTVSYSRPSVKKRAIWGKLVPFNKVWRTGANEPTIIIFDDDVKINDQIVAEGQYALFSIPQEDKIKFILNSNGAQWGSFEYTSDNNVLEFEAVQKESEFTEHLTFSFNSFDKNSADLCLMWERKEFCFNIKADVKKKALDNIEEAIRFAKPDDYKTYLRAVNYSIESGNYLEKAEVWSENAIRRSNGSWDTYWAKANLYAKNDDFSNAVLFGEKCLAAMKEDTELKAIKESYTSIIYTWKSNKK